MKIVNNTHYFSYNNKTYNIVPDTDSWQFESAKRLSYSQRLYWEYKYIKSCGGQAFFYTFTYNNKSLPHFECDILGEHDEVIHRKFPCFNYAHIRLLTNGIISKVLRRKYGSQLRYFVACERGEGKGFRGKGMNPHYHVIFFISPLPDNVRKPNDVPYHLISPISFCHLCKCVWQYQSIAGKYDHLVADYKSAKFGHCQPGDDLGLITDFDALSYVSKYVVKDTQQTFDDRCVREHYVRYFKKLGYTYHSLYSYYHYLRFTGAVIDRKHFLQISGLEKYFFFRSSTGRNRHTVGRKLYSWFEFCSLNCPFEFSDFLAGFKDYFDRLYLPEISLRSYRVYCNQFGSKVRCSKSLGIYGLQFVNDFKSNPHFTLDKSKEVVNQPICLYYYRKLYMNVVRCPQTGNPLYVLNEDGINLKCLNLRSNLDKLKRDVYSALDFASSNSGNNDFLGLLSCCNLDIYKSGVLSFSSCPNFSEIIDRFVVYRFIYQFRHYDTLNPPALSSSVSFDSYLHDYRTFLRSNYYTCDYSELYLLKCVEVCHSPFIVSFDSHPYFFSFISYFRLLESILTVFRDFMSEIKKSDFSASNELRSKLNAVKFSSVNI